MKKRMLAMLVAGALIAGIVFPALVMAGVHTVRDGDVLWRITRDYGEGATW